MSRRINGIAAGQRPVWPDGCSHSHTIALTLSRINVFPMTHHVECVALFVPAQARAHDR